jgi:cell division protein ZapA
MAQVSLHINGYAYILGCADGEEEHLFALAGDLDRRIQDIKEASGPSGEARLLLMAALMVADELHDLREAVQNQAYAQQQAFMQQQPEPGAVQTPKVEPKAGRRLRGLTKRAEAIAASAEALPMPDTSDPSADRSS